MCVCVCVCVCVQSGGGGGRDINEESVMEMPNHIQEK